MHSFAFHNLGQAFSCRSPTRLFLDLPSTEFPPTHFSVRVLCHTVILRIITLALVGIDLAVKSTGYLIISEMTLFGVFIPPNGHFPSGKPE